MTCHLYVMNKLQPLIILIVLANNVLTNKLNRIVGGNRTEKAQFPFFAQLDYPLVMDGVQYSVFCGASLIHPKWILSAGHCFPGTDQDRRQAEEDGSIGVYMGTNKRFDPDADINAGKKIHIHPEYEEYLGYLGFEILKNDIAIVELYRKYAENAYVHHIQVPARPKHAHEEVPTSCRGGIVVGTGQMLFYPEDSFDTHVNYAEVQVKYGKFLLYMTHFFGVDSDFYSVSPLGKGHPYSGDSGGPYICYYGETPVQYGWMSIVANTTEDTLVTGYVSFNRFYHFVLSYVPHAHIFNEYRHFRIRKPPVGVHTRSGVGGITLNYLCLVVCVQICY